MKTDLNHAATPQGLYLQVWALVVSLSLFGLYVLHDLGYLALTLNLDRSHMASLTLALLLLATAHCGWQLIRMSRHIAQLQHWLDNTEPFKASSAHAVPPHSFLHSWLDELREVMHVADSHAPDNTLDNIIEITAERFRSSVDLGWFFVDLAVRLGLLSTIIGFILIFASLTNISIDGSDELKALLIAMSGGMGTALLTTLTGLVTASTLSVQYLILGRASEHLSAQLLRVSQRYQSGLRARSPQQQTAHYPPGGSLSGSA